MQEGGIFSMRLTFSEVSTHKLAWAERRRRYSNLHGIASL